MMKFFRKHNKKLLAVFMVLLMIVFLGGSALDSLLRPSGNRVVATSYVGDISFADHRTAEAKTRILSVMGLTWDQPFGGMTTPLDTIDWILLTREAKQLGMATSPATVRASFGAQDNLLMLSRRLSVRPDHILTAMAELDSIRQTARAVAGATTPSEAEVRAAASDSLKKVKVAAVVLPGKAFIDEEEAFSESEIEAQFQAYREREAGPGLEFGYYVQPTVKLQYIRIDKGVIAEGLRVTKAKSMDRKARDYYDENHETDGAFRRPPEESAPDEGDEPIEGPVQSPYLVWEEARKIALDIVAEEEAKQATTRIADWTGQRLAERWLEVLVQRGEYKKAPETVARLEHYDETVESLPKTIAFPEAVSVATTDFFNRDEANDVPLIGLASFRPESNATPLWLRQLAFQTEAIVPIVPPDADQSDYVATFQTCRYPLTDSDGNTYVFRVVDSQAGHIPESIDEVRDRVVADLRLLSGYDIAQARAESLRSCADTANLQELYESDDELVTMAGAGAEPGMSGLDYVEPPPFARTNRYDAMRGERPEKMFVGGGLGPVPTDIVDQCFALEDAYETTAVLELKQRATVMVVQWLETQPAPYEEFTDTRESFVQQMAGTRMQLTINSWLDPEQIRARNGFKIVED